MGNYMYIYFGLDVMILAIVLFAIHVSVVLAVYYDGINEGEATREREIVNKYPGYFRTEEEQRWYDTMYRAEIAEQNVAVVNATEKTPNQQYCTFTCQGLGYPQRKRRQIAVQLPLMEYIMAVQKLHKRATVNSAKGPPIFHGCCVSRHFFTSPDFAENCFGNTVKLVQFDNKRQYFPTQECKQAANCYGCGCGQENMLVTAVIKNPQSQDNDDKTILDFIKLPGCCKCFNNLKNFG